MPELPEVETIKRGLEKKIVGLIIQNVQVLNPKSFQGDPKILQNAKIIKIWRRAKVLGIDLHLAGDAEERSWLAPAASSEDDRRDTGAAGPALSLLFHLKMSGQIILVGSRVKGMGDRKKTENRVVGGHPTKDMLGQMPSKSTRVIFTLQQLKSRIQSPGKKQLKPRLSTLATSYLYFNDQRKFGWVKLVDSLQLAAFSFLKNLGPEPLEEGFTPEILKKNLSRRQKSLVKVAILDQQIIAGIGNIYACESLFLSSINPKKLVGQLTLKDYQALHKAIIQSLETSIKYGGSTKTHYYNESGEKGFFLDVAYVYDRKGLPCRICQTPIEKITIAGRGTYFCPKCQN